MARTPDDFPGERVDESLWIIPSSSLPAVDGEIFYLSGSGFQFHEEGVIKMLGAAFSGSGITEAQHEALNTLNHDLTHNTYDEVIRTSCHKVTQVTSWDSPSKIRKVRDIVYNRASFSSSVMQVVSTQYDNSGVEMYHVSETITRNTLGRVKSIVRNRVP